LLGLLAINSAQGQAALRSEIGQIAADAQGHVAVACALPGSDLNCDLDPDARPPMQSVFKFPLALAMLQRIEQGAFTLDQPIRFLASDRILPTVYSPLQDQYPEANVDIPLRELLRLAVVRSDNVAADVVLRVIGGPRVVDRYVASLGVEGFHLEDNEAGLHGDVRAQYRNWFMPRGAVALLRRVSDRSPLTREHTDLLLGWLRDTPQGPNRLKANLPAGTIVMHKPGTSATSGGLTYATNDIGLIVLPDGRRLAIAVFVTDATSDEMTREAVIARIGRAAYDAALIGH
jgi:beta-lactamase class A